MLKLLTISRKIDWPLFLSVAVLSGLGLLAIWSVDLSQDPGQLANFKKQLVFVIGGFALALFFTWFDYRALRSASRVLYIFGIALMGTVLIFGATIRGTRGWLEIGSSTFQPVELLKVILIIVLAKYLSKKAHIIDLKVILNLGILSGAYIGLVAAQPDFGSAFVLTSITIGMLLMTNVPRRYLVIGLVLVVIIALLGWGFVLKDYQKARVMSVVDPGTDPFGRGYNIRQSIIAVGAGGIFGQGLGKGSQSQLRFLPEAQTDFIFAVLAEQLGLFAVLLILGAYGVMTWRVALIFKRVSDGFALFLAAGFFVVISVQVLLNVGMNLGVLPIVGLPLPFVSLGGSALLSNFLMLGIVQSIKVRE